MGGKLEGKVQAEIRAAVNRLGWARLVRNNTGVDAITHVRFGLGLGGADLIGWTVMPSGHARVLAIEVKREKGGVVSDSQVRWISTVNKWGGAACVCRSAKAAVAFCIAARAGQFWTGCPEI